MEQPKNIEDSIYTISEDIIARRRSIITPVLVVVIGIAMLAGSISLNGIADKVNLSSSLLFIGVSIIAAGVIFTAMRILNKKGQPFYLPNKAKMTEKVSYYESSKKGHVVKLFDERNLDALESIASDNPSPLMFVRYFTPDKKVAVMQIQEYVPHMYIPITEAVMLKRQ